MEKLPSKYIFDKIKPAIEKYSENALLRIAISEIPIIGSPLDIFLTTKAQKIINDRIMGLFSELKEEMSTLEDRIVDKDYIDSEEFIELFIKIIEASTKTRNKEKIKLYAKLLKGAIKFQDRKKYSPEEYLQVLSELTIKELEVAKAIYRQQRQKRRKDENELEWALRYGWEKLEKECPSIPEEDFRFIFLRLRKSGLIQDLQNSYFYSKKVVFVISDVFRKIMKYLEQSE
jgi:flagellin-specific chaperone FliS